MQFSDLILSDGFLGTVMKQKVKRLFHTFSMLF